MAEISSSPIENAKFRGLRLDGKGFEYGYYGFKFNTHFIRSIHNNDMNGEYTLLCDIIPLSLGQFTGIKDKNETEIYEGDIVGVKLEDSVEPKGYFLSECEVKFYKGCWCLFQIGFDYSRSDWEEISLLHREHNEMEVIGNIHENN